ncbi:toxin VasX [Marinobacter sp. X15-166B]|uniref:toxin VasX n=1 Tax=Marinobacter sp. X15-166B TaxID=1897620 RepID=UPI00085C0E81|nr:toxin VasX [Marinobacter sp. X15-166B]OEY65907.1 hypothetical protein BG841_05190 [Marinobacter sp. X15-166B]
MGNANSAAFLQGTDDINSAVQMCPLPDKTVALYPVRWAVSQEETPLPAGFSPPAVSMGYAHYCLRKLTAGWVYLYSGAYGVLHEYRVDQNGEIRDVQPGINSVLLPGQDAELALPCIEHPAAGQVFLKFVTHRWPPRLQELVRTDAAVRTQYMQVFELDELPAKGQGDNIAEVETVFRFIEEFRPLPVEFGWSLTAFNQGTDAADVLGVCKKTTEYAYGVALDDEIGIAAELGQLHALYVHLIKNHAEENAYAYTTAHMVDALIARETAKKTSDGGRQKVTDTLRERIRASEKDAFVEHYHRQIEEYDQIRTRVFADWKQWMASRPLARKLELNDTYSAEGFRAVEQELADILDGYGAADTGREDASTWLAPGEDAGTIGDTLKSVLFLVTATNKITEKLKALPGFDYGTLNIVDRMDDMPGYVPATAAADTLLLEFAAPAAAEGGWAADPQTRAQWQQRIRQVARRYGILIHEQSVTLEMATELLMTANRRALATASGYNLSELALSPLAAGILEANARNRLRDTLIDVFHLTPDFRDNPFGWLHTRLDPVVADIKQNRGKFIGAVALFQAVNLASLFSGLQVTRQDVVLADRSSIDQWLPMVDGLWSLAESVINLSGLLIRTEYAKSLGVDLAAAGGKVSVVLGGVKELKLLSKGTQFITKTVIKYLPYVGPLLTITLESRAAWQAQRTGHSVAVVLAGVQIGLAIGIGYLTALAVAGTATLVGTPIVLVGAVLVVFSVAVTAVQLYIARSRIEEFLCQSFWGDGPYLRYWAGQSRPENAELLEASKALVPTKDGAAIRAYFEAEMDAFYHLLFSPVVSITDHVPALPAITRQGEHRVLSEITSLAVYFPGYREGQCAVLIRLYEANRNLILSNEWNDITGIFRQRRTVRASPPGATYRFTHYNHNKCDQLELLIEYVKGGRKVTGDGGLRVILDGTTVKELGVNERLTFEL